MISVYTQRYQQLLEKLQNARRDARLTQVQVAEAFGKPQSFVSKCESGERRIDVIELGAFASLYRKPLTYFVGEMEAPDGAGLLIDRPIPRAGADASDGSSARPGPGAGKAAPQRRKD